METTIARGNAAGTKGFKASEWLRATWMDLVNGIAEAMRMTPIERDKLAASRTARVIGAIPFAAGCRQPERTALAHLATYLIAAREGMARRIFDHTPEDDADIYSRLRMGMSFDGGNADIIQHGMALLALNALQGYEHDMGKDKLSGEYNPLNSGAWDFQKTREALHDALTTTKAGGLDAIVGDELMTLWNPD